MSNRRTRVSRFTEDEMADLIMKLQTMLPDSSSRCNSGVSASEILKKACKYIKKLHKEVDGVSERLARLLDSTDISSIDADILRSLLHE